MESPNKVVIDTNMLLYIEKFNIDIFEEIKKLLGATEFFITKQVEFELSLKGEGLLLLQMLQYKTRLQHKYVFPGV